MFAKRYALCALRYASALTLLQPYSWVTFGEHLARIFYELLSRDHEDGRATWQPQGVGSEAYLNGTSQGPTPEDVRKDGHIRGRSK
jgi:hypothetical protein